MRDRYIATYTTDGIRGYIPTVGEPGKGVEKLRSERGDFIRHSTPEGAELQAARVLIGRLNGARGAQTVVMRPKPQPPAPAAAAVRPNVGTRRAKAKRELERIFSKP